MLPELKTHATRTQYALYQNRKITFPEFKKNELEKPLLLTAAAYMCPQLLFHLHFQNVTCICQPLKA